MAPLSSVFSDFHREIVPNSTFADVVNEISSRLSSLSETSVAEIKQTVAKAKDTSNAQYANLQELLGLVETLLNGLKPRSKSSSRKSSSSSGRWPRFNSKNDDCTDIKDVARRLNDLAEYYKKHVTQIEAESNEETSLKQLLDGYNQLSPQQKRCFAYCSLFPEDYKFDVPKLINFWTAEGYLASEHNSSAQCTELERGQNYFREFVKKSFFKDPKEDELGKITTCKMNPLIHGLAALITGDKSISMDPDGDAVHGELRQVSFHHSLDIPDSLFDKAKKLETILLPAFARSRLPDEVMMSNSTCERIFSTFKSLRVLDLHNLGIKVLPSSIGELKHLKHLDLSENNAERLPSSITKLTNLERLKLSQCHGLKELPKDLKKLVSFKHLEIEGCLDLKCMPPEM